MKNTLWVFTTHDDANDVNVKESTGKDLWLIILYFWSRFYLQFPLQRDIQSKNLLLLSCSGFVMNSTLISTWITMLCEVCQSLDDVLMSWPLQSVGLH